MALRTPPHPPHPFTPPHGPQERQWTQHEAFLREHIREFGTEHLALVQLGHSEIIEDIPTNGNGSDNPSAGEPEDDRIFKLAPSKLIPQPPVKSPKAQADSAPRNQNPATNAVRKLNEPAPWKKKDKLHYLLHEQNADIHEANAHVMKASQVHQASSPGPCLPPCRGLCRGRQSCRP